MKVVVFDTDVIRREKVIQEIQLLGHEVIQCYSLEKLRHLVTTLKDCVYLVYKGFLEEFKEASKDTNCSIYDEATDFEELFKVSKESYQRLILIGSSTGGAPVVSRILKSLRELEEDVTVVICQHIGGGDLTVHLYDTFKKSLPELKLIQDQTIIRGGVYMLAGGSDYEFKRKYGKLYLIPVKNFEAYYHPSFNHLLKTSELIFKNKTAIFLSGLGDDGAQALKGFIKTGGKAYAQDPTEAAAPFMPQAAIDTGLIADILKLEDTPNILKRKIG